MKMKLTTWFRQSVYGRYTWGVLLALGSAAITVALSFLPYETILQAVWVVAASLFIGFRNLSQRLNETDEVRYRRLYKGRFAYLEKNDPESLNTIFADNLRGPVLQWFEEEYEIPLKDLKQIDALDSLARSGDVPGQLIFRTGIQLGQWLDEARQADSPEEFLEKRLNEFVNANEHLLGEEIQPGVYVCNLKTNDQRPVGVHLFHPRSQSLFTIETGESETTHVISLSFKSVLFENMNEQQWNAFRADVHKEFPVFKPAAGGSGPQKSRVPLFISPRMDGLPDSNEIIGEKLERLMRLILPTEPAEEAE